MLPPFIDLPEQEVLATPPGTTKRSLLALSELDVSRDILDFTFVLNSDIDMSSISYFLEMKKWDPLGMEVQINFTDPLLISKGGVLDQVICKVRNRHLFVSAITGKKLETQSLYLSEIFPKQLPTGVSEEQLQTQAESAGNSMKFVVVLQLLLQICMKGALNDLWTLYFTLQIIAYLNIYDSSIPGNTEIFITELTNLVEFKVLNLQGLVQLFDPEFNLKDFILGKKDQLILSKDQKASVLNDLGFYLIWTALVGAFLFIAILLVVVLKRFGEKIRAKLVALKNKFIYNGVIRSATISYIQICITTGKQLEMWL